MKLCFKFFIYLICFVFINISSLFADEFSGVYDIELSKIDIGKLFLNIKISDNYYKISIKIKNKPLLSNLYKFEGNYEADGFVINNVIAPSKYNQFWLTKKKKRVVEIFFKNGFLAELKLVPEEKEKSRIEYIGIENYFDPLSSFLNILLGAKKSKTIDGRRVYSMIVDKKSSSNSVEAKKILKKLGWKAKIGLGTGLSRTFDWYLNNKNFFNSVSKKLYINRLGLTK